MKRCPACAEHGSARSQRAEVASPHRSTGRLTREQVPTRVTGIRRIILSAEARTESIQRWQKRMASFVGTKDKEPRHGARSGVRNTAVTQ